MKDPETKQGKRDIQKWVPLLMLLFLLFFFLSDFLLLPFMVLIPLSIGWLTYPLRVWPEATVSWPGVITGVLVGVAVVAALHTAMRRLRRRSQQSPTEPATSPAPSAANKSETAAPAEPGWRFSSTLALVAILVMGFAFSLSAMGLIRHGGGLMKQEAWGENERAHRYLLSKAINNIRMVTLHLLAERRDQGDLYPPTFQTRETLRDLRADKGTDGALLAAMNRRNDGTPDLWIPIEGIPIDAPGYLPLFVSPFDEDERIIVARVDASVTVMTKDQWQAALEEWQPWFAERGIPWPPAFEVLGR